MFARVDVTREATIANVEAEVGKQATAHLAAKPHGQRGACVASLFSDGVRIPSLSSVEQVRLFGKQRTLVAKVACD